MKLPSKIAVDETRAKGSDARRIAEEFQKQVDAAVAAERERADQAEAQIVLFTELQRASNQKIERLQAAVAAERERCAQLETALRILLENMLRAGAAEPERRTTDDDVKTALHWSGWGDP